MTLCFLDFAFLIEVRLDDPLMQRERASRCLEDLPPIDDAQRVVHAQPEPLQHGGEVPRINAVAVNRRLASHCLKPCPVQKGRQKRMVVERLVKPRDGAGRALESGQQASVCRLSDRSIGAKETVQNQLTKQWPTWVTGEECTGDRQTWKPVAHDLAGGAGLRHRHQLRHAFDRQDKRDGRGSWWFGRLPGPIVARQAPLVVNDPHTVRQIVRPIPENDIAVGGSSARGKARDNGAGMPRCLQIADHAPAWRLTAPEKDVFPVTGEIRGFDTERLAGRRVAQVGDIGAIDVVGADRQWLRLERKTLLGL